MIEVKPQTVPLTRDLVGRLSPYRSADVRARVPGVLLRRVYEEGSDVREGQVLFEIDPAPLQASLGVAQGQLAQAEATYANARAVAERARKLVPQKFVSQNDLDNAVAAERSAGAAVEAARASVRNAQIDLGYAKVTSPIAGRAGKQRVTEGALVGQGEATLLTTVDQLDPLYANFSIGSNELAQLRAAANVSLVGAGKASVQVVLPGDRVHEQPGTLDFSDTTVDPQTGAVAMRAQVPNPGYVLFPGSFVTLKVNMGELHDVFLVPQEAVLRDANGAFARVVGADGNVERRNLTTGGTRDNQWIVTAGDPQESRALFKSLGPQPRNLQQRAAAAKWAGVLPMGNDGLGQGVGDSGDPRQQRHRRRVEVDADCVDRILDDRVETAGQGARRDIVLILADADRLRFDFDQFGQRIL
mgnify:CR=1 FL=1